MATRRIVLALLREKAETLRLGHLDRIVEAMHPAEVSAHMADDIAELQTRLREAGENADLVAVAGGDGTLNGMIDTLMELDLPLLIIPLGTANDLARTLELPMDPVAAAGLVNAAEVRRIDIGRVNGHSFFNVASIGLSVGVAQRLTGTRKRWGIWSYLFAAADVVRARRSFRVWIRCDNEAITMRAIQVSVGNGRYHGGGITVAEDAEITDGLFDVYALEPQPWWRLVVMLPAMYTGRHRRWRTVTALRGRSVELRTRRPRLVNADGEVVARTPARFELIRAAIAVLVPGTADRPAA